MAKFDPKAKAKRQKIIAGVLGLVLVGVLVFQAPTILGMFGGGGSESAEPAPVAPLPVPVPVAPGTPAATPAPAGGTGELVDSDPAPAPADGQLVSFDRFESKDPFAQQLVEKEEGGGGSPAVPADPDAKADDPEAGGSVELTPQPSAATASATISVNGVESTVAVGGTFPEDDPIFKLASLRNGVARVGIVGGSYANGSQTITLRRGGKPVTLMNTADGTTYVLRFVK